MFCLKTENSAPCSRRAHPSKPVPSKNSSESMPPHGNGISISLRAVRDSTPSHFPRLNMSQVDKEAAEKRRRDISSPSLSRIFIFQGLGWAVNLLYDLRWMPLEGGCGRHGAASRSLMHAPEPQRAHPSPGGGASRCASRWRRSPPGEAGSSSWARSSTSPGRGHGGF